MTTAVPALDEMTIRSISNVSDAELDTVRTLVATWHAKRRRNVLRTTYYDAKMPFRPTGNIPPEAYAKIRTVLGWPAKAVTALAQRTVFDGFVAPDQGSDPFELSGLLDANRFDVELPQAIVSAFKHSCSFITTARGDVQAGEPEVLVLARSAEWSAGLWDRRRRVVSAALAITESDDEGRPTAMDVYLPEVVLSCVLRAGRWAATRQRNPLREVLVEPLTYDPQLDRPFGRSRITRPVMSITDQAIRTIVRAEIGADFFAVPRLILTKLAEDAIQGSKWKMAIDRFLAITKDEDGDAPDVQQLPQLTMQPLLDLYRMYATQFAGETGLPVSSLGIVQDNPPSAEALYAAEKDLIVEARGATRVLGGALRQVGRRAVMLRDGVTAPSDELRQLSANWLNPSFTSPVTAADALSKLASVFPWLGETEVALEYAGFTQPEVVRLLADKRRSRAPAMLEQLAQGAEGRGFGDGDAAALKDKFDALGVAIRAGVDPEEAAQRLGLGGIAFTGAVPVSLRMPEREAGDLEDR